MNKIFPKFSLHLIHTICSFVCDSNLTRSANSNYLESLIIINIHNKVSCNILLYNSKMPSLAMHSG